MSDKKYCFEFTHKNDFGGVYIYANSLQEAEVKIGVEQLESHDLTAIRRETNDGELLWDSWMFKPLPKFLLEPELIHSQEFGSDHNRGLKMSDKKYCFEYEHWAAGTGVCIYANSLPEAEIQLGSIRMETHEISAVRKKTSEGDLIWDCWRNEPLPKFLLEPELIHFHDLEIGEWFRLFDRDEKKMLDLYRKIDSDLYDVYNVTKNYVTVINHSYYEDCVKVSVSIQED